MEVKMTWIEGMKLVGSAGGHSVPMDAKTPIGKDEAPTPKELVALGMGGCTAMDVIALLKKHRQLPERLEVKVEIVPSTGKMPAVFESAVIVFSVDGAVDPQTLAEAVALSQTKYCGVNAMLAKALPITYRVELNGQEIARGEARFEGSAGS